MSQSHFGDRLVAAVKSKQTPLVVGIDPRVSQLPDRLRPDSHDSPREIARRVATFSKAIIDVVADLVPAVKPQAAFFEQLGPFGCVALGEVVDHARSKGLVIVMDAKRGDIGSTAAAYAAAYLGPKPQSTWGCDALTVNPYLGQDTLQPFIETANSTGSGLFVLAKTSNPGSDWIQGQPAALGDCESVFQLVAYQLQQESRQTAGQSGYGNIGAVIGATYPEQLAELRQRMPNTWFLIPGFGAQGGTAADVAGGLDEQGLGGIINSSRGIIFAYEKSEHAERAWEDAIRQATLDTIARLADGTPASKL